MTKNSSEIPELDTHVAGNQGKRSPHYWALTITVFGILLVLCATLLPFDFTAPQLSFKELLHQFFSISGGVYDTVANVFLFVPVSLGLTALLHPKRLSQRVKLLSVLAASFGLSATVELLQVFLPERDSCLVDILVNTAGGGVGCWLFYQQHNRVFQRGLGLLLRGNRQLTLRRLLVGYVGYVALILVSSGALIGAAHLTNWDLAFPLAIGNEATGNRPWQGQVSEVYVGNRAISTPDLEKLFAGENPSKALGQSLVAAYQLNGEGNYSDQTGQLPSLIWQGSAPAPSQATALLSPNRWLTTETAVTPLTQQIRKTSQFTLVTAIATADLTQKGPARLISVSANPDLRNFTLGQDGSNLIFRLRTPISGNNGTDPQMVFPSVFTDTNPHRLVITYSGSSLKLYIDNIQRSFVRQLTPEANLSRLLLALDSGTSEFNGLSQVVMKLMYYGVLFTPLGILLGFMTTKMHQRFTTYLVIIYGGIVLPAFLLEGFAVLTNGTSISLENLLFSMAITAGSMLVMRDQVVPWLKAMGTTDGEPWVDSGV